MANKYKLYEIPIDSLPERPRAVYSHYENGRMLILYQHKRLGSDWKLLTDEDIKNLTDHERQWYVKSRNEINAEYFKSPKVQKESIAYTERLLEIYEENLRKIQNSMIEVSNADKDEANLKKE